MCAMQCSCCDQSPAECYLDEVGIRIAELRRSVPRFTKLGEQMAKLLLKGGGMYTPAIAKFFPNEFCFRSGGMMGIRHGMPEKSTANDIHFVGLPDPRFWNAQKDETLAKLLKLPGHIFVVGREEELPKAMHKRVAGFTGGADIKDGCYAISKSKYKPLTSFRSFEQFARGWMTKGEMVAACTRGGKMPILWMSVWLEGAMPRNAAFVKHDNMHEPWYTPIFHDPYYVPPLEPGYVANAYLDVVEKIHARLIEQADLLQKAGQWMAAAHKAKKKIHAVAVGHSYPEILELKNTPNYPITWAPSHSDLTKAVPATLGKGDVAIHYGYSPVDLEHVKDILARGVKFIYTTPFGRPAGLKDHPNLLWFDLPWRPADATVDIPGYSVRVIPMSSTSHAMAYNAMLAEFANVMDW